MLKGRTFHPFTMGITLGVTSSNTLYYGNTIDLKRKALKQGHN